MDLKVETSQGWTEVIIDNDCGFVKFYRVADILTDYFELQFTQELDHHDGSYKDFDFNGSKLCLHYNIYLGISVYPVLCKEASASDNAHVLEIGRKLFERLIDLDWEPFDNGSTIGQPGTEGGQTIIDMESLKGARITLEKHDDISFAITLGIYGLMMHTHFESDLDKATEYVTEAKWKINKIIDLYDVEQEQRNEYWDEKREKMINELAEMPYDTNRVTEKSAPPEVSKPIKSWWKKLLGIQ